MFFFFLSSQCCTYPGFGISKTRELGYICHRHPSHYVNPISPDFQEMCPSFLLFSVYSLFKWRTLIPDPTLKESPFPLILFRFEYSLVTNVDVVNRSTKRPSLLNTCMVKFYSLIFVKVSTYWLRHYKSRVVPVFLQQFTVIFWTKVWTPTPTLLR